MVAVRYNPQSSMGTGLRNRLHRILGTAWGETPLHHFHAPVAEPLFERGGSFSVNECNPAFCVLPGLGEGKTPHHMARPHSGTGVCTDQAGFHIKRVKPTNVIGLVISAKGWLCGIFSIPL
jgi:hypothetical protein